MDTLPNDIHVGMKVYDSRRKHIGKIDDFKFSENATDPGVEPADIDGTDKPRQESLLEEVAEAFGGEQLPEALRAKLLREGYIRLDSGLLAADRYIVPSQIASAAGDEVTLNVEKDQLVKTH